MSKSGAKQEDRKKFICPECGTSISSSYNLKVHLETRCSTEKKHVCDICQSRFLTIHSLKTHTKSIHNESNKFVCAHCGKSFASKGQLTVHERCHNKQKPFVCKICSKAFSHRETLVTHSTVHTKIKPYACENCHQTFSCVGNLIKHRKVRPNTCGLPIFTNKKICKRAGVKCAKRKVPEIIVDTPAEVKNEPEKALSPIITEEKLQSQEVQVQDHQYVIISEEQNVDLYESTKEFTKKEMEVLDFMSFDVRNLQEPEYHEVTIENTPSDQDIIIEEYQEMDGNITEEYLEDDFIETDVKEPEIVHTSDLGEMLEYVEFENGQFLCRLCPKIYSKKNITIRHLKKEHNITINSFIYDNANRYRKTQKNQIWKCRICPRKYTTAKMVEKHELLHGEDGNLIHKCPCCTLHFETVEEQHDHQYSSHKEKLICNVEHCQKKFDHPEKLLSHKKYSHSDKKGKIKKYTFVCPVCGKNFNTKIALSDHERSNCGKNPIYKCHSCDKSFQSAGNLKVHLTVHTAELNFSCQFCPKKFRTKGQLTVHNRSHLNIKPFKCKFQDCHAEFAHRESLLTHHTIHTGIKRFECEKCLARFSCISNLLAHRRSRRKNCSDSRILKVKNAETSLKAV